MKIKQLGRTGLKVTEVGLGTMTFGNQADPQTSFAIMDLALEAGVTFFDTANVYPTGGGPNGRTEEIIGDWIQDRGTRDKIVLATKCRGGMGAGPNDGGLSRKHILHAVEESLRRLKTDYIDLYQLHSPDADTPIDETLRTLDTLVQSGKVRYIGCSNFPAWQLAEALWTSDKLGLERFESVQPRYNLVFRMIEDELLPLCKSKNVGVIAYNPLAGGILTGRYRDTGVIEAGTRFGLQGSGKLYQRRYWNEPIFAEVDKLRSYFEGRGKSLTHASLAWVLAQPQVTVTLVGASKPEQLRDTLGGVGLVLDAEELATIEEVWYALPKERDTDIARR